VLNSISYLIPELVDAAKKKEKDGLLGGGQEARRRALGAK